MTPEQIASLSPEDRRALLEALQMQGIGAPEDPNLEAAATPITPDPEVVAPKKRVLTPYEEELRLRSMARRAGVSAAVAKQMLVADAANDFQKFEPLRLAANDRRDAELARREQEVVKKAQLRSNPMAYIGRDDITEEQRQAAMAMMPLNPAAFAEQIRAKSVLEASAASDKARSDDRQWLATHQEGVRRAAEEAAARAAAEQRAFEGPHKDKDREATAQANADRMGVDVAKFQADLAAQTARNDQAMKALELQIQQANNQHAEVMARLGPKDTAATVAQARLADLQAEAMMRESRAGDENVLGEKYAKSYVFPWWLGGGYDDFTIAEQQQMYDELLARGYKEADAMRAVDAQANKRRAYHQIQWGTGG